VPDRVPFDLDRFVSAQDRGGTYGHALEELRLGRKRSHWMWFVFPQLQGLGSSPTARTYAISSLEEARAFLRHPTLGARLLECSTALLGTEHRDAVAVLGPVDAQKLRSSMTLFARADPGEPTFQQVLDRFFDGRADPATDARL
jgi:uncharacterized protein (DUF1810 family)